MNIYKKLPSDIQNMIDIVIIQKERKEYYKLNILPLIILNRKNILKIHIKIRSINVMHKLYYWFQITPDVWDYYKGKIDYTKFKDYVTPSLLKFEKNKSILKEMLKTFSIIDNYKDQIGFTSIFLDILSVEHLEDLLNYIIFTYYLNGINKAPIMIDRYVKDYN